jgi:hypothetical protein
MTPPVPLRWRHVIINTKSSWLHADKRGFRSRGHRIHCSGDYRNPPPITEHGGLRVYHQERAEPTVFLDREMWSLIGCAIRDRLIKEKFEVLVVSVGALHSHALTELPNDPRAIRAIIGRCKRAACEAVKHIQPGTLWSAGGQFTPIKDDGHRENTYRYIETQRHSWVCSQRKGEYWNP